MLKLSDDLSCSVTPGGGCVEDFLCNLVLIGLVGMTMTKSAITASGRFPPLEEADLVGNDWSTDYD